MTLALCPECGCNLTEHDFVRYGNVMVLDRGEIAFENAILRMPRCQYDIVKTLILAKGRSLTKNFLAYVLGNDINESSIAKYVQRTRDGFREIDPSFEQIISLRGFGAYRWKYRDSGT